MLLQLCDVQSTRPAPTVRLAMLAQCSCPVEQLVATGNFDKKTMKLYILIYHSKHIENGTAFKMIFSCICWSFTRKTFIRYYMLSTQLYQTELKDEFVLQISKVSKCDQTVKLIIYI